MSPPRLLGMLRRVGLLRRLLERSSPPPAGPRLRPAGEAIERYRDRGGDPAAALEGARAQLLGLRHELDDDPRWDRLVLIARQIGDPWNADDWPLGFDALLCVITLCTQVSFECARCPVGRAQQGRSCAHPSTAVGRIGDLVRRGDRQGLRAHIDQTIARLERMAGDPA
ncbi:MAG: hypothetical protein AB1Z98_06920 [Nannocystaceae bacterium]